MLRTLTNRVLPIVLALLMIVTLVPSMGNTAYADDITYTNSSYELTVGDFPNSYGPIIKSNKSEYEIGEDIYIKVEDASKATSGGWIGIYDSYSANPDTTSKVWTYTGTNTVVDVDGFIIYGDNKSSAVTVNSELSAGTYYIILMASDGRWAVLPITITSTEPEPTYDDYYLTINADYEFNPIKTINGNEYQYTYTENFPDGLNITVNAPSDADNEMWVGIYEVSSTPGTSQSLAYAYVKEHVGTEIDLSKIWVEQDTYDGEYKSGDRKLILFADGGTSKIADTVNIFVRPDKSGAVVNVSPEEFDYTGEPIKPTAEQVTVDGIGSSYYDIICDDNILPGEYEFTVKFKDTVGGQSTGKYKINCVHAWDEGTVTTPATCETAGVKTYTCTVCGETKTEEIAAPGHTWNDGEVTTEAKCETAGVKTYTCTVCEETKTEEIAALGHTWNDGEVTTEATCETAGVKTYTCTVCGETKTEEIAALGHDYHEVVGTAKEATCKDAGNKNNQECTRCGAVIPGDVIPATGNHTWDEGKVTTEPTETAEGVRTYTCTVCGETKTEVIAKLVPADPVKVTMTINLEGELAKANDGSYMAAKEVTVEDLDADGELTYDEALVAAHKAYNTESGYVIGGPYTSVQKLWGVETANTLFFINNEGIVSGVKYDTVKEGDYLVASVNKDNVYYADWYTYFEESTATAAVGDDITLTLMGHYGMAYFPDDKVDKAIAGVTVKTADGTVLGTTDESGKVTFSLPNKGTYVVTAEGTTPGNVTDWSTGESKTADCPIIAPQSTVTVTVKEATPTVTLSKTSFIYNGKIKRPGVTVKVNGTKLTTADYTVKYASGRKNVGKYSVKVTLKNNYSGSATKYFKVVPKKAAIKAPKAAKGAITVKWTKQAAKMSKTRITGYQVQVATNSKFTKNKKSALVKGYSKTSKKITGLKSKKTYYVRVRTYKTVSGTKYYSSWSKVKKVKTK